MATLIHATPAIVSPFAWVTHTAFCNKADDLASGVFWTVKTFLVSGWRVIEIQSSRCSSQNFIMFLCIEGDTRLKMKLMVYSVLVFILVEKLGLAVFG